jgi:hypothetical protein
MSMCLGGDYEPTQEILNQKQFTLENVIIESLKIENGHTVTVFKFNNVIEKFMMEGIPSPEELKIGDMISITYQIFCITKYKHYWINSIVNHSKKFDAPRMSAINVIEETKVCNKKIEQLTLEINDVTHKIFENLQRQLYYTNKPNEASEKYKLLKEKKINLEQERDKYIIELESMVDSCNEGWTYF